MFCIKFLLRTTAYILKSQLERNTTNDNKYLRIVFIKRHYIGQTNDTYMYNYITRRKLVSADVWSIFVNYSHCFILAKILLSYQLLQYVLVTLILA